MSPTYDPFARFGVRVAALPRLGLAFAAEHDVDPDEVASVVKEWVVEGILLGSAEPD
jgi:hypothetical protein